MPLSIVILDALKPISAHSNISVLSGLFFIDDFFLEKWPIFFLILYISCNSRLYGSHYDNAFSSILPKR